MSSVGRVRAVVGCTVWVFAMSVLCAAGAQATPEYFKCVKKTGGNYSAKGCPSSSKVGGTGKYERESAVGMSYKLKSKTIVVELPGLATVTCTTGKGGGEITGQRSADGSFELKGCASGGPCTSAAQSRGTVEIDPLEISVGGTVEEPEVSAGQASEVTTFVCELERGRDLTAVVRGSSAGRLASPDADVASKKGILQFSHSGGLETEVIGFTGFEPAFETAEYDVTYSGEVGIT